MDHFGELRLHDVAVTELRAHLGRWIDAAREGTDIVTDRGTPVARIVALDSTPVIDRLAAAPVYFDSSALVKLVLDEAGSDIAAVSWPVELSADVERAAGSLAATQQLSGADAVHLASALALGSTDLTVAVWDERLHAGAAAVGLAVVPANLD